jgi:antitoxin component YwqK of YwqJK toxin-antitoxin module
MGESDLPNAFDNAGRKTGPWSEADPHGGVMRGTHLEGERHGTWRHFFADGRLRAEGTYDRGVLYGAWTWYRATGGLLQKGSFDQGEKHGIWERWDANGSFLDATTWNHGKKRKPSRS